MLTHCKIMVTVTVTIPVFVKRIETAGRNQKDGTRIMARERGNDVNVCNVSFSSAAGYDPSP